LRWSGRPAGFAVAGLARSWYSTSIATIPRVPSVEVEHERRVEGSQAAEVGRIEASGRVFEADLPDGAGCVGPPAVQGAVGE
jgi:hypothetical protein